MTAGLVHLTVVPNQYEAEMLCALLRTEGLTCDQRPTNLAVGMMDGINRYRFQNEPQLLVAWESARHVVTGADSIEVTFADGGTTEYPLVSMSYSSGRQRR